MKNFTFILLLMLTAIPAAASGGNPHMGWRVIDFVIFVGILYYFLHKPISDFFRNRKTFIKQKIDDAEHILERNKIELKKSEEFYQNIDKAIAEIQSLYEKKAAIKTESIIKKAREISEGYQSNINEAMASEQEAAKKIIFGALFNKMEHQLVKNLKDADEKIHRKINDKIITDLRSL